MINILYKRFINSGDTLWVYSGDRELFTSRKKGVSPLVDYIKQFLLEPQSVIILDRVIGNAAALLSIKADAVQIWSPLGSEPAVRTLTRHGIQYHFDKIVPLIQNRDGSDICPMEKNSLTADMTPEQFYETLCRRLEQERLC